MSSFASQRLDQKNWVTDDSLGAGVLESKSIATLFEDAQRSEGADTSAINSLLVHYLPIVIYQANKLASKLPAQVEADDLVQAGTFGLRDAIFAFDAERGIRFETYCAPRVYGSMLDSIRDMDWVPRLVRRDASIVKKATDILWGKLGHEPNQSELIDYFKTQRPESLTPGVLDIIQGRHHKAGETVSLSHVEFQSDSFREVHTGDMIPDRGAPDPTERIANEDLRRALLKGLNKAQRLIYVLYVVEELPMKEVGDHLNLSESRVSQMFSEMIRIWQGRVEAAAGGFKDEFALIADRFRVSKEDKQFKVDISQEVIQRLDEINALSTFSFCWQEHGEDYQSGVENDDAIQSLIEKAAELRLEQSLPQVILEKVSTRPQHREAIPISRGSVEATAAFGFVFQEPQVEQDTE